ncbi:hypothetical protein, partial [Escherichia coli]|uniref:hypothetical protein n=1 Tax=Escherichia coli TaxID=562 RepID=UPI003BA038E5
PIPDLWSQVRKRVGDIRATLPREIVGPFFNDEFGDTYGNIYALTGKGFDYAVMRDYADRIQLELQRLLYLLHRHTQRGQAGVGQLDPHLLVLQADQVDLADIGHALQFQ